MASIRRHARSPFWYVRRRDMDTGRWIEQSTGLLADSGPETRKAERIAQKYSVAERRLGGWQDNPAFITWVPTFLATHYRSTREGTGKRMQTAWQAIKLFLSAESIIYPRQVRYHHGQRYIEWRKITTVHDRAVRHNTALLELKFLSQLLNEAVRREYLEANPLLRLGIPRVAAKIKPELTDDEIKILLTRSRETGLKWLERCIWIATYTGCRFSETAIDRRQIDLETNTLTLIDAKRHETDPRKQFTIPIPADILHIFREMDRNGETVTCRLTADKNGRVNYFFRSCGIQASFHSLRVTFVTRCHRAGLSESEAMALVNHSSELVHRVYSRLNVRDKTAARARIQLPTLSPETP